MKALFPHCFPLCCFKTRLLSNIDKGIYPQSDGSLAIVNIDVSKRFVDLLVHLSFAIFTIFDLKRQLKLLEMAFDQVQTCLIFPFRWAYFRIKNSRKAQWVHPFSMNFNGFRAVCLYYSLIVPFRWKKCSFNGNTIYFQLRDVMPFDQNRIVLFRW